MKVLLTGAAGRIGSVMCHHFVEAGFDVRAGDRTAKRDLPVRVEIVNMLDREACYRLVDGVDAIVHLANHPDQWGFDPQTVFNENVAMNENVFQAAAELGVGKIVFASSIQVIGGRRKREEGEMKPSELSYLPLDGDHPANCANGYALSKRVGEVMLEYYTKNYGMSCVVLRIPGVTDATSFPRLLEETAKGPRIGGAMDEAFSYITRNDLAELAKAILLKPLEGFRIYHPSARTPGSVIPVADLIKRYFWNVPLRKPVEQMKGLVDISRIQHETGWTPREEMVPG